MSKIMRVYYDNAGHPYKDYALSTLYPIVGNEFTGANNTTDIHFYCDNMGEATWVANCVLPNGEKLNRLLVSGVDGDGHTYQTLPLDSELTSIKGHLKIGLNGYAGNISIDEEELENNDLVVISGTPTIIATGIIDIAMNYSPIVIPVSQLTPTEYQELLALIGNKLDVIKGILVAENIGLLTASSYNDGQIFYNKANGLFYRVVSGEFQQEDVLPNKLNKSPLGSILYGNDENSIPTTYTMRDVADQIEGIILSDYYTKVESDGRYVHQTSEPNVVYATDNNGDDTDQMEWSYDNAGYTFAVRYAGGKLSVGTPQYDNDATTKKYVDDNLQEVREVAEGKNKSIVISYATTAPTTDEQARALYTANGNHFTSLQNFLDYVEYFDEEESQYVPGVIANGNFNSQNYRLDLGGADYIITDDKKVLRMDDAYEWIKQGDIILVLQIDVPDRWYEDYGTFNKMETSKVDLSGYVDRTTSQTIGGAKTFSDPITVSGGDGFVLSTSGYSGILGLGVVNTLQFDSGALWTNVANYDLGKTGKYWRDIYLSRNFTDGTRTLAFADLYDALLGAEKYPSTELQWNGFNWILATGNITFTKQAAPANTYPEYHGSISNGSGASSTLTFTGIRNILCNDDNIVITNGTDSTMVLPNGTTVEFSIIGSNMVAINWSAN